MFVNDKCFISYLKNINEEIDRVFNHQIAFEEYVIVPYYGFIILRFNLKNNNVSLDDLDKYETKLYEIVGNDYLVDFMGSVYHGAGVDFTKLPTKLKQLNETLREEVIEFNPPYKKAILKDAEELLKRVGLELNLKVWEIQIENNEINLLLLGKENRLIKSIKNATTINVYETSEEECLGLIRAVFNAKRNKYSLVRLLL